MKLKKHREDVLWLKSWPDEHEAFKVCKTIAKRYQRLILAFECGKPATKLKHIMRVLKDAE